MTAKFSMSLTILVSLLAFIVLSAPRALGQNMPPPGHNQTEETGSSVILSEKELFTIKTKLGPFTPAMRAENIKNRLERLASDPEFDPKSVHVLQAETTTDITAGDIIILTITDDDARAAGMERTALAETILERVKVALADHKAKRSLEGALEDASLDNFLPSLKHMLFDPLALKFLIVLAGGLVVTLIVKLAQKSLGKYVKDSTNRYASRKIATFAGYIVVFVLSIVVFRDTLSNLAVIIGAATAGIAFALKEVIISLAGWVALSFGDFYKVGDRVQLAGIKGDVIDIGFARTTLMELGEWVKGDLYTGRIVRVANSFIFTEPMFNYSGDFPFIWDEITVPIKYGTDHQLADKLLKQIVEEVSQEYVADAQKHWSQIERKFLVENARTEPMVTLNLNDNWIEFTLRYVVEFKRRRLTKDALFRRILDEFDKTEGRVAIASATFHLVETPPIDVRVQTLV